MRERATDTAGAVLGWMVRFPGHLVERALGLYLFGLGVVYLASPEMLNLDVFRYLKGDVFTEAWQYGLVFSGIGLVQTVASFSESGHPWLLRVVRLVHQSRGHERSIWLWVRVACGVLGAAALGGIAQAFAPTGAWTGPYNYGYWALFDLLMVGRLGVLWIAHSHGLQITSSYVVDAMRRVHRRERQSILDEVFDAVGLRSDA